MAKRYLMRYRYQTKWYSSQLRPKYCPSSQIIRCFRLFCLAKYNIQQRYFCYNAKPGQNQALSAWGCLRKKIQRNPKKGL